MRRLAIVVVGVLVLAFCLAANEQQVEDDELVRLRAENAMLKRQRTGYLKYVGNQALEILRLKKLLDEAGIDYQRKEDVEPAEPKEGSAEFFEVKGTLRMVLRHRETGEIVKGTPTGQKVNNLTVFKVIGGETRFLDPNEWEILEGIEPKQ